MRMKVTIPLLLAGAFVVFLPFIIRPKQSGAGSSLGTVKFAVETSAASSAGQWKFGHPPAAPEENPPDSHITIKSGTDELPSAKYEDYVNRRVAELGDLGMTGDIRSLLTIESELDNRDPRIRAAAVSAAIQFGSRDAIPALRDAFGHTDDPAQKLNLQKAIELLELPSELETANTVPPQPGGDSTAN